jgi:uncharacterized protein (TIGR00299 family) protein
VIAVLDCFSGISGDMLLGALVDAGVDVGALRAGLSSLELSGWRLEVERASDHGLAGTRAHVVVDGADAQPHRHLAEVEAVLAAAGLPERTHTRALAVFHRLAVAEAAVHGTTIEAIEFHEVGAVDSIVDVAGVALGLELLGIEKLYCASVPMPTGGFVATQHGSLPVPAPATLALLTGSGIAIHRPPEDVSAELVTPTGAAIIAALARADRPQMALKAVGYGFGQRHLDWPNGLRLLVGEPAHRGAPDADAGLERDEIVVLEANIDNMTGEALGWLMERLLAAGALDVTYQPMQMKKNRPATRLTALARPAGAATLAALIVRESSTLGVRMHHAERLKAGRRVEEIETPLGRVHVKLKLIAGQIVALAPEYDDCRALAVRHGLPIETVRERISHAARTHFGLDG